MPNRFYLCCCLLLLMACQPKPVDLSSRLLYQQPELQLFISPASAPVETPLKLTIKSDQPLKAVNAELSGVSMYMGRIPLLFQKLSTPSNDDAEQWQAEFLLGACSDPAMLWQLNVTLQLADGAKVSINEQFTSSW